MEGPTVVLAIVTWRGDDRHNGGSGYGDVGRWTSGGGFGQSNQGVAGTVVMVAQFSLAVGSGVVAAGETHAASGGRAGWGARRP